MSVNPSGLCFCGCGEMTPIAARARPSRFVRRGDHFRFVPGHQRRKSAIEYVEVERGHDTPCWIWQRATNDQGYPQMWVDGRTVYAHRVFHERAYGPIPAGRVLDHLCLQPGCVNPSHTEAVTHAENLRRGRLRPTHVRAH